MILPLLMLIAAADDCDDPVTQIEMTLCARADYERADVELNQQWKSTLAEMRRMDKESAGYGYRPPGYADALLASQRAWIAYRDAQCTVEGQENRGGSAEPMVVNMCLARMTRERTAVLAGLIGNSE